ncbi:MAG TPA: hypothetical protein VFL55_06140, partial [Acetobacteraceae bacterium]|nr:hypothetical protein [Acetobacteraceae bacterium]
AVIAATTALSLLAQNTAWAVCSDGSTMPAGGFVVGKAPVKNANNFSPGIFTAAAGSIFIPDTSVNENNDPTQPPTGGGHNWVFDQGSTLCKVTDVGKKGVTKSWSIPPNTPTQCVVLPVIRNGVFVNVGDIPFQGEAITPTCDPTKLSGFTLPDGTVTPLPNPNNTKLNQLGCSISQGQPTDVHTATTWLFVDGPQSGLFNVRLENAPNVRGGDSGKTAGPQDWYAEINNTFEAKPLLTGAAISPDGSFAIATSIRHGGTAVYGCLDPLGYPGDPSTPIDPNFNIPQASTVKCMPVGSNGLAADLTTAFATDNQPYFGGQRLVDTFNNDPGGTAPSAWPQCIIQGKGAVGATLHDQLVDVFNRTLINGCGTATPNTAFSAALITQPSAIVTHTAPNGDQYLYITPVGGTVVQYKLTTNTNKTTRYSFRTYLTGISLSTGLGVADDLQSLIVMTDPSTVGLAGQGVLTQLPLCEDMP